MQTVTAASAPLREIEQAETVWRVVYASVARVTGPVYEVMAAIRESALKRNVPLGVHTALLHQSGFFVHWKEGPKPAVDALMRHISRDRRHGTMRAVHASFGPRLLDGPWSMALVHCEDSPREMAARVLNLVHRLQRGTQDEPPAAWRKLSTPMKHPSAGPEELFQRVLVCASAGFASFQLVAHLAATYDEDVVQRRFAGSAGLDVGSDYVDFHDGERVVRVVAMARNGLALPLIRAMLADYSHIVLLLSGDAHRDEALVEKVAYSCARLPEPPVLVGVAAHARSHIAPRAVAAYCGMAYTSCLADPDWSDAAWEEALPLLQPRHPAPR